LAEIAPGNFRGHDFVARRQKARFLPAAPMQCAYGASAAISADMTSSPAGLGAPAKSAVSAGCAHAVRLRRFGGNFRGHDSVATGAVFLAAPVAVSVTGSRGFRAIAQPPGHGACAVTGR